MGGGEEEERGLWVDGANDELGGLGAISKQEISYLQPMYGVPGWLGCPADLGPPHTSRLAVGCQPVTSRETGQPYVGHSHRSALLLVPQLLTSLLFSFPGRHASSRLPRGSDGGD